MQTHSNQQRPALETGFCAISKYQPWRGANALQLEALKKAQEKKSLSDLVMEAFGLPSLTVQPDGIVLDR